MPRPGKLPMPAQLVVWGATKLTMTEKVVWYHTWFLDQGREDGCYIGAKSLGPRLGVSPRTVEDARSRLGRLLLLRSWPRAGCREFGYAATLPPGIIPPRTFAEVTADLPAALDRHIEAIEGGPRPAAYRDPVAGRTEGTGADVPTAGGVSREGGRGEGASSVSQPERQLLPASQDAELQRKQEEGAFARANDRRGSMTPIRALLPRDQVA